MNLIERLRSDWTYVVGYARILLATQKLTAESEFLLADAIEAVVDKHGTRDFVAFEDEIVSYAAFEARANRFAHWGLAQGFKAGDCVALFMENRPDYLAFWFGMAKIAVKTALINSNLTGAGLAHCIKVVNARALVMNDELIPNYLTARDMTALNLSVWSLGAMTPEPSSGIHALAPLIAAMPELRPDRTARAGIKAAEIALYIYTSGTTGLPKAAKITHIRAQGLMRAFVDAVGVHAHDRILLTLPLYHATGGMCGVGCALNTGATLILRRKFSASHFWEEAIQHRATMLVYIGELGRYLMNQPATPAERAHTIVKGFGNGLRADVWAQIVERTGIKHLVEFYGSTEGNVNFFNLDGKIGAVGRIPPILKSVLRHKVARFDVERGEPVRGANGFCIEAKPDEIGEAIGPITSRARNRFDGYNDPEQTKKKVLTDAFETGDMWFRTGDLMRRDKDGYFYFVDRIGDTFRWKSENVSTTEVEMALSAFPGVLHAIVYGVVVPGYEGRAGMAALTTDGPIDLGALNRHLARSLPGYARPVFLRQMQEEAETTGTLKYRKVDLVAAGFDPGKIADPLYVLDPGHGAYANLDAGEYVRICSGKVRL